MHSREPARNYQHQGQIERQSQGTRFYDWIIIYILTHTHVPIQIHTYIKKYIYIYIYIYKRVCVFVCVCVCKYVCIYFHLFIYFTSFSHPCLRHFLLPGLIILSPSLLPIPTHFIWICINHTHIYIYIYIYIYIAPHLIISSTWALRS